MDLSKELVSGSGSTTASTSNSGEDAYDPIKAINGFRIFISVIGLFGNIVVISSILLVTKLRRRITSWYVLQLAIADTAYLITLPFQVVEDQRGSWVFPDWMCKAKNTVMYVNYYSSIFLLTIMALDRYVAICHGFSEILHKFRTRRAVYIISASVWIVSILISIPVMINTQVKGFKPYCTCLTEFEAPIPEPKSVDELCIEEEMGDDTVELPDYDNMTMLEFCRTIMEEVETQDGFCSKPLDEAGDTGITRTEDTLSLGCHYRDATAAFKGFIFFNFIVMFLVPFVVISVCYTFIILYMRKTTARMGTFDRGSKGNKNRTHRKVFIMCAILVIVFTICWLPFHSVNLAKLVGVKGSSELCRNLGYAMMLLTYLNSAINPFVYFIATRFRSQIRRIREVTGVSTVMSIMSKRTASESGESKGGSVINKEKSTNEAEGAETEKLTKI